MIMILADFASYNPLPPPPLPQIISDEESNIPSNPDGVVEYRACCNCCDIGKSTKGSSSTHTLGRLFYDRKNRTITMVNTETCLGRRVFLLGQSEKAKRKEVIGQFGESIQCS